MKCSFRFKDNDKSQKKAILFCNCSTADREPEPEFDRTSYLTGVKFEKSAQPVSELELAAGDEFHPASGRTSAEEGEEDKGQEAAGLLGLEAGAVDVPVSMGMSSKLAVHTGPEK